MQDPLADSDQCQRVGIDEKYINFRSSPNFKNMKKFLKSKIDYNETADQSSSDSIPDTVISSVMKDNKPEIHPPLPRDPPPSDSLPITNIPEKETDNTNCIGSSSVDLFKSTQLKLKTEDSQTKSKKQEICKDFMRGTCTRANCIYAHDYTFCHNFQNSVCTLPSCQFVHATVFEEAAYYRTGLLPPHTLAHQKPKPVKLLPPPPPPPLPENTEEQKPKVPVNPMGDKPVNYLSNMMSNSSMNNGPCESAALKPNWSENGGNFSPVSPGSPSLGQPKTCDSCQVLENRLQHAKKNAEKITKSMEEFYEGIAMLRRKEKRLQALMMLLQPEAFNQPSNATSSNAASKMNSLGSRGNILQ